MNSLRSFLRHLPFFLALLFSANQANATLTDGSISPDLTLTDINGNAFNLYQQLGAGKTVFLEFVAAWDANCWNYHNAQHLQSLYALHGPNGSCSDDVIVVLIESDLTTGLDALDGTSPISAGNWIADTPYSIFNPSSDDLIDEFLVTTFPTIYRICPSKIVRSNGQISTAAHTASIDACNITNDVGIKDASSFYFCNATVEPVIRITNVAYPLTLSSVEITFSVDDIEQPSVVWNGNVAPGQQSSFTLPALNLTAGLHEISCGINNLAENSLDLNQSNNCLSFFVFVNLETFEVADLNLNFDDPNYPYPGWINDNPDLSNAWQHTAHEGGMMMLDFFTYGDVDEVDMLYAGPVDVSSLNTPYLSFDVAYATYSDSLFDGLGVAVSSDCGITWNDLYYKEGQELATGQARTEPFFPYPGNWRSECIFLGDFASSDQLWIAFIGFNGWGNNLFIDNVNLNNSCIVSDDQIDNQIVLNSVFPNPAHDTFTIRHENFSGQKIECSLFSLTGDLIQEITGMIQLSDNSAMTIDCSSFGSGIYLLKVKCGGEEYSSRLVIIH
jgi:hypothetical protein